MDLSEALYKKLGNIKILAMDLDGVLTDARIVLDPTLGWKRVFSVRDGIGLHLLRHGGYKTAVITGAHSEDVRLRVKELKIDYFYENRLDKNQLTVTLRKFQVLKIMKSVILEMIFPIFLF